MIILQIASLLMIALLLISMMAKARPWKKAQLPGKMLQTIPLGFFPKVFAFRSTLLALLTGCVLCVLTGWLQISMALMVASFALFVLFMPMQYTLTTKGIAVGEGNFRLWSDFSGFKAGRRSLVLANPSSFGRLTLFVKPAEMDSVSKYVARHVKAQSSNS